jgi:hypothetical protein
MPKLHEVVDMDQRRSHVTNALMETVHDTESMQLVTLKFHDILSTKLSKCNMVWQHANDIKVVLKGGMAYRYVLGRSEPASDMDIVVYIRPSMPMDTFCMLKKRVNTIVLQTISQYKRALDHMLFLNKDTPGVFLDKQVTDDFKLNFGKLLAAKGGDAGTYTSPFLDTSIRNQVSQNSFIITDSKVVPDTVLRVEVPHFEMCENIPLRRTPIFCTHNRSISFTRSKDNGVEMKGSFDLYRLRFNCLFVPQDPEKMPSRVPADLIDVSILHQDDAELSSFWQNIDGGQKLLHIADPRLSHPIYIMNMSMMLEELEKMLFVYNSSDQKREKREERRSRLAAILSDAQHV